MTFGIFNHGTSTYFNNFAASREQEMLESLVIESIKIYGHNIYYMPRTLVSSDSLYTEDDQSDYSKAYSCEVYIKSVDGFEGDGVFLSKLGLQIQDQVTFTISKRIFEEEIGADAQIPRPNEGDVIYFPLNQKVFQVMFVNYKPFFYQLGKLMTYDLVCETFTYSGETFHTGYSFIDRIQYENDTNQLNYTILGEDGTPLLAEDGDYIMNERYHMVQDGVATTDNDYFGGSIVSGVETDQPITGANNISGNNNIIDWSYENPFSEYPSSNGS